jgi:HlyD family type I secretion membrane fusion protein
MSFQFPALAFPAEQLPEPFADPQIGLRRTLRLSFIVVGALIALLIAMASVLQTSAAVIGNGKLTVESSVKRVAHPTGGVIAQLYVKEGDRVRKGDSIMRFDNTVSGGSTTMLGQSLEQLLAARARLIAERDGAGGVTFSPPLADNSSPSALAAMNDARRQFDVRRQLRLAEQAAFQERINQSQQEIAATQAQFGAASRQSKLIQPELDAIRDLYRRRLVTLNRLNQMERTAVELGGSASAYASNVAQARARIAELRQTAMEATQTSRSQAAQELGTIEAQLSEQRIRSLATTDATDRSLLRAPYAGVIEKLAYLTVGGVVPPTQTIVEIVPDGEPLIVEVSVSPNDVDQLYDGERAILRFSGLNRQTTPEVQGVLYHVAAEPTVDERTGVSYFSARVRVSGAELSRLGKVSLKPGMPVEAFFHTGSRSLMSYLTKPLVDQFSRAFRE